jgi:uncharacterized protein (TIGR03435 family)
MRANAATALLAGLTVFALACCPGLHAQSQDSSNAPAFEVVSIKPNRTASGGHSNDFHRDRYTARNVNAKSLILRAYGLTDYQLVGGPNWITSEYYDIDAKLDDSLAAQLQKLPRPEVVAQMQLVFQAMLADRFQLKISHEARELPIYALVVAKNGPKVTPRTVGSPASPPGQGKCCGTNSSSNGLDSTADGTGVPLTELAKILTRQPELGGRVVLDQTGLKGDYDFSLKWTTENLTASPDPGNSAPTQERAAPGLFTALQEQLGLKLEASKGQVEVIVIQHIERPSEN